MEPTLRELTEQLTLRDAKLIEDEKLFKSIFFINPIPLSLTKLDDGTYLYVNEAFCVVSGYTTKEIIGKTPLDLGFYHNIEERQVMLEQINKNGYVKNFPIKFYKREKKVLDTALFATITTVDKVEYIIAAVLIKDEICEE